MQQPKAGLGNAAEYQVSGLPFATSSIVQSSTVPYHIQIPYVTKFISVRNTGTAYLAVGFTENGVKGGDRFTLAPSGVFTEQLRIRDLFLLSVGAASCNFELVAGLTMIERNSMPVLTGSSAPGVLPPFSSSIGFGYGAPNIDGTPGTHGLG
jgi:hypothetical protein